MISRHPLARALEASPAQIVFGIFLVAIFFFNGGIGNALAIGCFVAAWALLISDARADRSSVPQTAPILLLFFVAISIRLLLPPTGAAGSLPGAAVARALLLIGLYGLTCYVYPRVPFEQLLLFVAGAAFVTTVISLVAFIVHPPVDHRLVFLGRASHAIFGAGAMAAGALAATTLLVRHCRSASTIALAGLMVLLCAILVGIVLTGSRGPMIALALAVVLTPIVVRSQSKALAVGASFLCWAIVTSSVLFEVQIKEALCPITEFACRASMRHDVWTAATEIIAQNPLWGSGYGFRFAGVPHAHNAYLGMALHYGIPLCLLFVALMAVALSQAMRLKSRQEQIFVVSSLIFANGFMGSDLSDPLRFLNTHYLFLWIPLFLSFVGTKVDQPARVGIEPRQGSPSSATP